VLPAGSILIANAGPGLVSDPSLNGISIEFEHCSGDQNPHRASDSEPATSQARLSAPRVESQSLSDACRQTFLGQRALTALSVSHREPHGRQCGGSWPGRHGCCCCCCCCRRCCRARWLRCRCSLTPCVVLWPVRRWRCGWGRGAIIYTMILTILYMINVIIPGTSRGLWAVADTQRGVASCGPVCAAGCDPAGAALGPRGGRHHGLLARGRARHLCALQPLHQRGSLASPGRPSARAIASSRDLGFRTCCVGPSHPREGGWPTSVHVVEWVECDGVRTLWCQLTHISPLRYY
jgi:hypothetical protein